MVSLRFPVRLSSVAFYADRKLFANGFLLAMAPMALLSHRKLWAKGFLTCRGSHGASYRQETFRVWFPIRLGSHGVFLPTGNFSTENFPFTTYSQIVNNSVVNLCD